MIGYLFTSFADLQIFVGGKGGKYAVQTIADVDKIADTISSHKDALEDAAMVMSHHAGWEQLLSPAPMTLAFLGQLLMLSLKTDFPLDNNKPVGGFKLLRQPASFRVSIIQVF